MTRATLKNRTLEHKKKSKNRKHIEMLSCSSIKYMEEMILRESMIHVFIIWFSFFLIYM